TPSCDRIGSSGICSRNCGLMAQLATANVAMAETATARRNCLIRLGRAVFFLVLLRRLRVKDFVLLAMAGIVGEVMFQALSAHSVNDEKGCLAENTRHCCAAGLCSNPRPETWSALRVLL